MKKDVYISIKGSQAYEDDQNKMEVTTAGKFYDKDGNMLYAGLPFCYSGYIHRAVLSQNVCRMDIDKWEINPKIKKEIETFLKEETSNIEGTNADRQKQICNYLTERGYRLYWDPAYKK